MFIIKELWAILMLRRLEFPAGQDITAIVWGLILWAALIKFSFWITDNNLF